MSPFYKYNFVSPEPTFAEVKEALRTHFDTGAASDLMFPKWADDCLKKLGRGSYPIVPAILQLDDFQATLPEGFFAVREAWLCLTAEAEMASPTSVYWTEKETITKLGSGKHFDSCSIEQCSDVPDQIDVVMKKGRKLVASFSKQYLLRPGNISVKANCGLECRNHGSISAGTFDVQGQKFVTNFRTGTVYLLYYSDAFDDCGNQQVPDNFRILQLIKHYVTYKVWEDLANNAVDEAQMNRFDRKAQEAKAAADEALIMASIEVKKETPQQKADRLARQGRRLNRFNIR